MQGTIAVLVALSGLGCHHKSCDTYSQPACYSSCYGGGCYSSACYSYAMPTSQWMGCYSGCYSLTQAAYWDSCYGGGCYGSSCYGGCYASACYGGCYGSCYGGCYGGGHHRARHRHGLFGCKRSSCEVCCASGPMMPFAGGGWPMGMPVYGTYTPTYYDMGTPQGVMSSQYGGTQYLNEPATTTQPNTPPPVAPETPEAPVEDTTVPDVDTTSPPINETVPPEPGVEGTVPGGAVETPVNPQF